MKYLLLMLVCFFSLLAPATVTAKARPLLDIVDVLGVRENQLVGYGLVVGLPGSGDRAQVKFAGTRERGSAIKPSSNFGPLFIVQRPT